MIALFFCVVALAAKAASDGCHFGYVGDSGVDHWSEEFSGCKGKHQSPVDINSKHVTSKTYPPFELNGFDFTSAASITNNGHTAMLTIDSDVQPTLTGGPLCGIYEFSQLHFHWGGNDTCGGENEINDKQYPLEMHMVFFKEDYLDVNSAMSYQDGLCVLGLLFEVEGSDNKNFGEMVKALEKIVEANSIEKFDNPPALSQLMPKDLSTYFTYNGSLTTPPCSEAVIWVDFDHTVKISEKQLQAFRSLTDPDGNKLINNFRAVQPLGDRIVYYCKPEVHCNYLLQKTKNIVSKVTEKLWEILIYLKEIC